MGNNPTTVHHWLTHNAMQRTEAESALCFVLQQPRSYLFAHSDAELTQDQITLLDDIALRRRSGEPLAYITGSIEFWSLAFHVSPDVLIPRDDTGCLVEVGLALLNKVPENGAIVDAGTGSGVIAIAFAHETCQPVIAIDQSEAALRVAEKNANRLTPGLISCQHGNWLDGLERQSVRLLLSNPPYIAKNDPHLQAPELQHEPQSALIAGSDGLDDLRILTPHASQVLVSGGAVAFEHGYDQGLAVRNLLASTGFESVTTVKDLSGHERVTHAMVR